MPAQPGAAAVEHGTATVAAYSLLEQSQTVPIGNRAWVLLDQACAAGWHDVACLAHYAEYARLELAAEDVTASLAGMTEQAERSDDDALVALVSATRGEVPDTDVESTSDGPERNLARAVARLDDGRGSPTHRPLAYVACALGYSARGLWELEEEMYARADVALGVRLESPLDLTQPFTRRVVAINRASAYAGWACGLAEAGDREAARQRAATRTRLTAGIRAELPPQWALECDAVEYLLAAIAGEPPTVSLAEVAAAVRSVPWPGYRGCALLGGAVRAMDAGDRERASALADEALTQLTPYYLPSVRLFALNLAARATATAASARYVEELTTLRWNARWRMLGAARSRLDAERIRLDNERLSARAYLDELTGVANRHAYARHLARLRRAGATLGVAVLMVDVDHFKSVNDRFGHRVGDGVLRRVAAVLAEHSRPSDLVARLGGDEFVLLLDGVHRADALRRGQELVQAVGRQSWQDLAAGLAVTVSAGLACGASPDVDALLAEADRRLYEAKFHGRGRLVSVDGTA
jgi:diguanylate cyclase (GGDEF)-like protein